MVILFKANMYCIYIILFLLLFLSNPVTGRMYFSTTDYNGLEETLLDNGNFAKM